MRHLSLAASILALCMFAADSSATIAFSIDTFAGAAPVRYADGPAASAGFRYPQGLVVAANGDLYIADTNNCVIRKLTPSGTVTTFAGVAGRSGHLNGPGNVAQFAAPTALAFDPAGNLLVGDPVDDALRSITPAGIVSTLNLGVRPFGIAIASDGTMYLAEGPSAIITKRAPDGIISTLAGTRDTSGNVDGTGAQARFAWPAGIALAPNGDLVVADGNNFSLRRITPTGVVTTVVRPSHISGIAFNTLGYLYAALPENAAVWQVGPGGEMSLLAGAANTITPYSGGFLRHAFLTGWVDGTGQAAQFNDPTGITFDGAGVAYVSDRIQGVIRRITPEGIVTTYAGRPGGTGWADGTAATARMYDPDGIAFDAAGNLYVADRGNNVIRKITPAGDVTTVAGVPGRAGYVDGDAKTAQFSSPYGVAVGPDGTVYVADGGNGAIRALSPDGRVTTPIGPGFGSLLSGVACDNVGTLYIVDSRNSVVWRATPSAAPQVYAGTLGQTGYADGPVNVGRLYNPWLGIAVDAHGNVYVADQSNAAVRKITPDGIMHTLAGGPQTADPTGSVPLSIPWGLALDKAGNVLVTCDATMRIIAPDGTINSPKWIVPPPTDEMIYRTGSVEYWHGIAIDAQGEIYAADPYNARIIHLVNVPQPVPPTTRIVNLSTRVMVGGTAGQPILGFVTRGDDPMTILLRAVGPTLKNFGVSNPLADPFLAMAPYTNNDWDGFAARTMASAGAFPLPAGSKDSVVIASDLKSASYTGDVLGWDGGQGVVLFEVYDTAPNSFTSVSQLVNASTRGYVGTGDQAMIAGFVISGTGTLNIMLRAVGPGLDTFGVAGTLADPRIQLYRDSTLLGSNDNWSDSPDKAAIETATDATAAFKLAPGSKDSALLLKLGAGTYTAHITGANGGTGTALLELYLVP